MKKDWLIKTLALGVVVLFIGVSYQPIIAEKTKSVEKTSDYNNIDFDEVKEYLFQTIIDISNNPDVKNLFEQLKYDHKIFTSDYDYKSVSSQLFLKKPTLLLSILFTKPEITYEYLDKNYNRGIKCVNILGEKQALEMTDSIKISNPDLIDKLNNIILSDKELIDKILTLEIMNNDLKLEPPFMTRPIMCAFSILIFIPTFILLLFFSLLLAISDKIPDFSQKFPNLYYTIDIGFFISLLFTAVFYFMAQDLCYY